MNRLDRRTFFGWLTGLVASLFGVKGAKAVEPELPWYLGSVNPADIEVSYLGGPEWIRDEANRVMRDVTDREQKWRETCRIRPLRSFRTINDVKVSPGLIEKQSLAKSVIPTLSGGSVAAFLENCERLAVDAAKRLNRLVDECRAKNPGCVVELAFLDGQDTPQIEGFIINNDGLIAGYFYHDCGVWPVYDSASADFDTLTVQMRGKVS